MTMRLWAGCENGIFKWNLTAPSVQTSLRELMNMGLVFDDTVEQ